MLKEKTSVMFISTEGKENKIVQVPTNIILFWRKYLAVLVGIIAVLMTLLGVFVYQSTSQTYKEKLAKANRIKSLIDIEKAKRSFKSIDESIYRINQFLHVRGLQKINVENVGGEEDFEITDINEISEYYDQKIKTLETALKTTPLGIPYQGKVTSGFGYRSNPFSGSSSERHPGMDFKGEMGDPVKTTADGVVEFAGVRGGYGNCIIIHHGNDIKTLYGHLSKLNVQVNQNVALGQKIGEIGSTGRSTGPHLHYEIIINEEKMNPELYTKF